jgi:ATP-binding cassette subfamily B protein
MFFDLGLWQFTRGVRLRIVYAVVIGLLAASVGIVRLALLGWLIGRVFGGASVSELVTPFIAVAAVMLLRGALEYWRNLVAHHTAAKVQMHLRGVLYDKVVALGPAYFGLERTGDVLTSLVDGVEQLETYFGQYLPQVVVAGVTPILVFAGVAFLDLPVAATLLGFAIFTLVAPSAFSKWDSANARKRQRAYGQFASEFLDTLQGLGTLKSFGQSGNRGRKLAEQAHELFRSTMWVLATNALARGITDIGLAVGAAAVLALGAFRVQAGDMPLEYLLIILMMGIEVFRPQRDLRALLHQGMVGQAAAKGIFSVLDAVPLVPPATAAAPLATLEPTISFADVHFTYPRARRPSHQGLSFTIAPGERVGVVGTSGAGKTSILRLLLRLYDPDTGSVRVGGVDLRELPADEIYQRVAVVNQDTYLFHGTVADNLRFGRPDATSEQLHQAAQAANAHAFISALPQGYDTVIGERGLRLSGGQRQRIAIARALLKDAPILVLDEALSAVDAENEAVIQQALDRLMQGRTTLIFAHRLSSIIGADRLLVLDGGRVVETGSHNELMAAKGIYFTLMRAQAHESRDSGEIDLREQLGQRAIERNVAAVSEADTPIEEEPTDGILKAEGMGWLDAFTALLGHVRPWRVKLTLTFVFGILRVIALIGVGVLSALTVAALKNGTPFDSYLVGLAVAAPAAGILHWLESWFAHDMAFRMLAQMRIDLYHKLDALSPAYLLRRRSGDLVSMATHDVEMVEYFFAHTIAPTCVAVLIPAAVVTTLAVYGWPMALVLIPLLAIVVISPFLMRHRIDVLGSRAQEALGDLNAHAVDTIQGLVEITAFARTKERRDEFLQRARRHIDFRVAFFRDLTLQMVFLEVATGLGGLAVVVTGATLVENGSLDASILPLLTLLAMAAFLPIAEIAHIGRQLADTLGATRRLYAVHHEPVPVRDGPGVPDTDDTNALAHSLGQSPAGQSLADQHSARGVALGMHDVRFTYFGRREAALDGVTFDVPAGKTVAMVGPSGAGKSTIAHLFLRFFDPQSGEVTLNGQPLSDYRLDSLRAQIALVSQDTYLFNETLRANILVARPEASEADLNRAVEHASLEEFVASLPEGIDTHVGERGVRLSGGQRQRVAIARAVLKDAPILVLDEATSHLDAVNEQAVRDALEALMVKRTTIVIAHRLSTVRNADLIIVLDAGRVVESGTHDSLLALGGLYSQLVGHQMGGAVLSA